MRKSVLILALVLVTGGLVFAQSTVTWKDAASHYGKYKTVEGTVVTTKCTAKVCFLNFDPDWKNHFTAVIFASDWPKFPQNPDQYYLNKKVQISGTIKEYKGKPEIILKGPDQIKIVK